MKPDIPFIFQDSWVAHEVISSINPTRAYTSSLVTKDFKPTQLKISSILRICRFLKTTESHNITCILADSTHKILAYFPFKPTIVDFENKQCRRITYGTLNNLIDVKLANLRFVNETELQREYNITGVWGCDVVVLEIIEFDIFQSDRLKFTPEVENRFKFVYEENRYEQLCKKKNRLVLPDLMDC
ncbi:Telomere replication protein EST3 [Spathaspora sp. JA1]|nr:Telomere replication protein EST3 [Spathaspora sp. JA1]